MMKNLTESSPPRWAHFSHLSYTPQFREFCYDGSKYKPLEDYLQREYHDQLPSYPFEDVTCLFGTDDELFSYKDELSMLFPTYMFKCGHHPDKRALTEMLPHIVHSVNHPLRC